MQPLRLFACLSVAVFALAGCNDSKDKSASEKPKPTPAEKTAQPYGKPAELQWTSLFDGKALGKWSSANFGGEGEVKVENGAIMLPAGVTLTGVTYTGDDYPKMNYEISLEAQKVDGGDFFCGLTFPV